MHAITFEVLGQPMGKQRPRLFVRNGKSMVYTPAETKNYEARVRKAYEQKTKKYFCDGTPIEIDILAYYQMPKTLLNKKVPEVFESSELPLKKPDVDNIAKIICDGLNGVAFHDDKQICKLRIEKRYAKEPKVLVQVRANEQEKKTNEKY